MPKVSKEAKPTKEIDWGHLNEKQILFCKARQKYIAYGGARGGGKSHVARWKAVALAMQYPRIQICMIRQHYPELTENLIRPILKWVPQELYNYNKVDHMMIFYNGSEILFKHFDGESAEQEFQGQQYDVIFIDEATQLPERAYRYICTCLRSSKEGFPQRMYLTCNPGGVGHRWVKRIFIDRKFDTTNKDPNLRENPDNYFFIKATVKDNPDLLKATPDYMVALNNLPEDIRQAHLYGDWDALGGAYFQGFVKGYHTCPPFSVPKHWKRYRSFDYGLDMLSVKWWAVDEDGRCWCYREFEKSRLTIAEAAHAILENSPPDEEYVCTYAPFDMWATQKDTGRTMAEIFALEGLPLIKAAKDRVQGHMVMKTMMLAGELKDISVKSLFKTPPSKLPKLMFFDTCPNVIQDIMDIQADEDKPNDCAKDPHDVTHSVDSCRYFCIMRTIPTEPEKFVPKEEEEEIEYQDATEFCLGGEVTASYLAYGGR